MPREKSASELKRYRTPSMFRLAAVQVACLSVTGLIAIAALIASLFELSTKGVSVEWVGMTLAPLIAAAGCGASLAFSISQPSKTRLVASRILAGVAALPAFFDLLNRLRGGALNIEALISPDKAPGQPGTMAPVIAFAFVLLALLLLLIRASTGIASHAADCIAFFLVLLGLAMVSGWLFTVLHVFGSSHVDGTPPTALLMLALLIVVAFSIRAQYGAFDILVGSGLGSRIARALAPFLLVIPFVREAGRARIIRLHVLPENSEAAILGAMAAMISMGFLILIARHIRRMEAEIRRLSLRDELTGLSNLRGFRLLAEQALRLAYRSQTPFSVLFVDVDRLKEINDTLGHAVGSALLVEAAALLNATFRETDVIARIGGDEFAVAGQFSRTGISIAAHRLAEQASLTRIEGSGDRPLSLSIGFATTREHHHEFLQDLLDEADQAMYDNKRRRRLQVC